MALTSLQAKYLNAKRQAMYDPKAIMQVARDGKRRKLLATIIEEAQAKGDWPLTQAELDRRADALHHAHMLALNVAKERKRNMAKAQAADKARYAQARTTATHGCRLCGDDGAIDVMCQRHLDEQRALMQRH